MNKSSCFVRDCTPLSPHFRKGMLAHFAARRPPGAALTVIGCWKRRNTVAATHLPSVQVLTESHGYSGKILVKHEYSCP